jgi:hypothetical protein
MASAFLALDKIQPKDIFFGNIKGAALEDSFDWIFSHGEFCNYSSHQILFCNLMLKIAVC